MGPQPQRFEGIHGQPVLHWHQKEKKKKLDCAFFLPGELFFFFNHPFPVRDPKLVILRLRFLTGGGAEKIGRFCSYEYVCVCVYLYVRVLEGRRSKWFLIDDGN